MGYIVIKNDSGYRQAYTGKGFSKYLTPKVFKTIKEAEDFISRRSYKGMSHYYEIKEIK